MRKQIVGAEIEVDYEPTGLRGRSCVVISFGPRGDFKLRLSLEDAENVGEALVNAVRRAEETAEK